MWFDDPHWRAAANACLLHKGDFDWILTPGEFHGLSPNFRPLEYSESPPPGRIAFLCHKDFSDNVSTAVRAATMDPGHYLFANAVFVLGALDASPAPPHPSMSEHLPSWLNRASGTIPGKREHAVFHTEYLGETAGRKALVIGASGFGNTGDDLLGVAAARLLLASGRFGTVHLAGFDLRRADLQGYDEVFIGGGGLLYVSQVGELDWQNLANYFKFPFWCAELGIPCHLLAIGHQQHGERLDQDAPSRQFLIESLRRAKDISTRDQETAALIRQIGGQTPAVGADLVFTFADTIPGETGVQPDGASGLLLIGEVFKYQALAEWLRSPAGHEVLRASRVGFALMSHDDDSHLKRLQGFLAERAIPLEVHDFRNIAAADIVETLRGYEVVAGTRFHGFVLGLLAGVRQIVFDQHGGKKDRLVRSVFPALQSQLIHPEDTLETITALLAPEAWDGLKRADPGEILFHAETAHNHAPVDPELKAKSPFRQADSKRKDLADQLLTPDGEIKLCWAGAGPNSNGFANLGDGLSAFMIANLAGLPVKHTNFDEDTVRMFGVGSIGHLAKRGHVAIWGTGCYRPDILINNVGDTTYDVLAVRGNISQQCLESVGIKAPACYGEPVWLLPAMFNEKVEKKYELGIISHISDLKTSAPNATLKDDWSCFEIPDLLKASITLINTWHEPNLKGMLDKLRLILSCKRIATRSFHGLVIAETYGIPCLPINSKPGVPQGAFASDAVKMALLDRRTLEFLNSGVRRPQYFYGQRRGRAMDWEGLIETIDRIWSPIGYDATPMLEAFPFDIPVDPISHSVPIHPSMQKLLF